MLTFTAGFCGFQPKKKGTYVVDVIQDGAKFPGSPFQIQIGDTEVCSPKKVKVTGAVREGMTQQWNDIVINVTDAGQNLSFIDVSANASSVPGADLGGDWRLVTPLARQPIFHVIIMRVT